MRFSYKHAPAPYQPGLERPIIPIVLRNLRNASAPAVAYEALVDSGSDRCIFPAQLAELLGITFEDTKHVYYVGGVVAGERRPIYVHPVEITVGGRDGPSYWASVGFMRDFAQSGYGLLGRNGFFDQFNFVKFKEGDDLLEIGKKRR